MTHHSPEPSPNQPRLFLAEADPRDRALWREIFEREGFEVWCFDDGHALDGYLTGAGGATPWPHVIVTVVELPGLTGLEVVERARKRGMFVPALVISGTQLPGLRARVEELGAAQLLTKPVNVDFVVTRVRALTEHRPVHLVSRP